MPLRVSDKRVMVTGGAGFLGRHVVEELERAGASDVFVPRSRDFDLRDREHILRALRRGRPELVLHVAAVVGGIGANRRHPASFFYDNAIMGVQLIHECWKNGVEKIVVVGTVCAYPKVTSSPFKEESLWDGYPEATNAPYGLAKKMLLVQGQSYRQEYGFNSVHLIPTNLYGPYDNFDPESSHVIAALIRKCVEAREVQSPQVEVWGTGSASRDFLFVEDAARALVAAAESYDGIEPVNVGSGRETSIRELAKMIAHEAGFEGSLVWDATKPDGQPTRRLDTTRAKKLFGFEARVSLEEGLLRTVEWYRSHRLEAQVARR